MDMLLIAPLFDGWEETMIKSCLEGYMGYAVAKNENKSAMICVGDFYFFAGIADSGLAASVKTPFSILVPRDKAWEVAIEKAWGENAKKITRYAIKKEPDAFNKCSLLKFTKALPYGFSLSPITSNIYDQLISEEWSKDLCSVFNGRDDFLSRGIGFCVLKDSIAVSGASSYAIYENGIEIEIDTNLNYRNLGLASSCGSALILECLRRGLYPSWDAHDLRSVALANKLGYTVSNAYTCYVVEF